MVVFGSILFNALDVTQIFSDSPSWIFWYGVGSQRSPIGNKSASVIGGYCWFVKRNLWVCQSTHVLNWTLFWLRKGFVSGDVTLQGYNDIPVVRVRAVICLRWLKSGVNNPLFDFNFLESLLNYRGFPAKENCLDEWRGQLLGNVSAQLKKDGFVSIDCREPEKILESTVENWIGFWVLI